MDRLHTPAAIEPGRLGRLFWWLRVRLLRNYVAVWLDQSRLRLSLIAIFSVLFWFLLFAIFFEGFYFIEHHLRLTNELVNYLFGLFFLSLTVMLIFSTGLIAYAGLFKSREAAFLLTTPASDDRIFAYKLQEALGFSSWGLLLLASPMMVAYGINRLAPAAFYVVAIGYFLAFVLIPGALGTIACLLLVNYVPRRRGQLSLVAFGLAVSVGVWWGYRAVWGGPGEMLSEAWLDGLLARLRFSRDPLLPSQWISAGLLAGAAGQWSKCGFYFLVILANAGFLYVLATGLSRRMYRSAYSRVQGGRSNRVPRSGYWLDRLFHRAFWFADPRVRLLVLKDLRTFRRDPLQWSQLLIFFGLLVLYFVNIRRLNYDVNSAYWRNLISFLNLTVTALILSTFTSRFVFPMLSLEGRKFWILGLLPMQRESILWGKFAFAAGGSLLATEGLVVLSDVMLRLGWSILLLHVMTMLILCMGLSGISVGLGARLPNLREDDPSKIAAGFGGTLNLVVSMLFIFAIVLLLALPSHLFFAGLEAERQGATFWSDPVYRLWMGVSIAAAVAIGYAATVIPLRIGAKAFRELEV
jgi:ABC-2 type transport system permease protein